MSCWSNLATELAPSVSVKDSKRNSKKKSVNFGTCQKGITYAHEILVHTHKKKSKELSSVYATQEFLAHNGTISVLKFSHDGRHLASAGSDNIVCVWAVSKYETNHRSELSPINVDKVKQGKMKKSPRVIMPPKVFRILEKPVHEFHDHGGEILSLSW